MSTENLFQLFPIEPDEINLVPAKWCSTMSAVAPSQTRCSQFVWKRNGNEKAAVYDADEEKQV